MLWSRKKSAQVPTSIQAELPEPEKPEDAHTSDTDTTIYPGLKIVLPIVLAVCLAVFLTALDRTIVGVAVPAISNEFKSFDDISWYESAFLLTFSAFQLPMGKVYTFFSAKWVFIITVVVFELGSVISAAAPTSAAFIIGRAISGAGSAGTTAGGMLIFVDLLPLEQRPKFLGFIGATFGLASIAGPLLGGVFTSKLNWRWCFWINLPIGAIAIVVLLFILPSNPPPKKHAGESFMERVKQFDPLGTALLLPGLVLLLLALQWGGVGYAWGSPRVAVSLALGLLLLVLFSISQLWTGENGTVPPRILSQRTIAAGTVVSLGFGAALIVLTFYLPIWFQAVQGQSAFGAGIRLLPYFLGTVTFVIASGFLVSKTGYYTPPLIVGTALMVVGCGLLSTFSVDTSNGQWIGYELVVSAGMGMSLAQINNAAQTVLSREDIPIGVTIVNFAQQIGGSIFVSVSQAILASTLGARLSTEVPGFDAARLSETGTTDLASLVPDKLPVLLAAYNDAIVNVFYCALAVSCLAFVASFFVEWKSVKTQPDAAKV